MDSSIISKLKSSLLKNPFKVVLEDVLGERLTFISLYLKMSILGQCMKSMLGKDKKIGLCLPNTCGFPIVFLGLLRFDFIPVVFNFKSGSAVMRSCAKTAGVSTIITSKFFVKKADIENIINDLIEGGLKIVYLEDVISGLSIFEKLKKFILIPFLKGSISKNDDPAVILFTSGSEGSPKAILLSHSNLISQLYQLDDIFKFRDSDVFFACLPFFHSFGLMCGLIIPIVLGNRSYIYPTPLDYKNIPQKLYESGATLFPSSNTFLQRYFDYFDPLKVNKSLTIFSGAEKLYEEVRLKYLEKLGIKVFQGYGLTETSPVVSVNVEDAHVPGSVGRLLKGIEIRIEPVEGLENAGKLLVKGPNIMLGCYMPENPEVLVSPTNGWHDTGDIASFDEDGFLYIQGRVKRFAKIGGEMISLVGLEQRLFKIFPETDFAIISIEEKTKGEKLVLITDNKKISLEEIREKLLEEKVSILSVPREVFYIESFPVLGSGKIDYVALKKDYLIKSASL